MVNYVKVLGAIVLSNVLVDTDGHKNRSLAGSPGGQVGSGESGHGIIANLTGALGGGAGELADLIKRVNEGGGGSYGNVSLQTQSGGDDGGNNGGIVSQLMLGNDQGHGLGLGSLLGNALSQNMADQDSPITITEAQSDQAMLLLNAMFHAANQQNRKNPIDFDALAKNFSVLSEDEISYIKSKSVVSGGSDVTPDVRSGLEQQAYVLSALSVNMESQSAAQYLKAFANQLGISALQIEQIHTELGIPLLEQTTLGGSPV